jgi:hypothetical protein
LFSTKLIACCIFSFCATFGLFKTLTLGGDLNSDLGDFILGILVAKVYILSPPSDFSFSSTSLSLSCAICYLSPITSILVGILATFTSMSPSFLRNSFILGETILF